MRESGVPAMAGRGTRVVRGTATAAFAILVAMLSHMAGGGSTPGVVGLALAAALAVPACILLTGRTVSTMRLSLAVASSQAVLHLLFSIGSPTSTTLQVVDGHHGMGGHVVSTGPLATEMAGMSGMHAGPSMSVAHVLAAVVTIVVLRFAERAFWNLLAIASSSLAVALCAVALVVVPLVEVRHRIPSAFRVEIRDLGVCVAAFPYRGPPADV